MNNMLLRAITGTLFITLVLSSIYFDRFFAIACLGGFMVLGLFEFFQLFKNSDKFKPSVIVGVSLGTFIYIIVMAIDFFKAPIILYATIVPLIFISFIIELWRKSTYPIMAISILLMGIFYITVPFILMIFLREMTDYSWYILMAMFGLIWANDTFAYLSGRMFGKTKLFERISPKKTWEGTIGGFVMTIVTGIVIAYFSDKDFVFWILAAVVISPTAVLGDLFESLFKRTLHVKDSGSILPGHGGILDRFDAALMATPFFYLLCELYL
jgi:phosphatidate cytidylyltransferase